MFKGKKVPHTYVIVFGFIIIAALLTWIVPGGSYERETIEVNGQLREVIVQDSFHKTENHPQTWQIFSALFDGFVDKADIIVFIIIIGGAFWIMNESKAIDNTSRISVCRGAAMEHSLSGQMSKSFQFLSVSYLDNEHDYINVRKFVWPFNQFEEGESMRQITKDNVLQMIFKNESEKAKRQEIQQHLDGATV